MASVLSLSFDSSSRVFVTECDPFCALQTYFEGVQRVAIKTVVSETSLFPQRLSSTPSHSGFPLRDMFRGSFLHGSMPEPGKNFGMHLTAMPDVHREGRKIFTTKLGSCCLVLFVWRFQ